MLASTIEVRMRLKDDKREWPEIAPLIVGVNDAQAPEVAVARLAGFAQNVVELRWNWSGYVAGLGQGHYSLGQASKYYND